MAIFYHHVPVTYYLGIYFSTLAALPYSPVYRGGWGVQCMTDIIKKCHGNINFPGDTLDQGSYLSLKTEVEGQE